MTTTELGSYYRRTIDLVNAGQVDFSDEDRIAAADELETWGLLSHEDLTKAGLR